MRPGVITFYLARTVLAHVLLVAGAILAIVFLAQLAHVARFEAPEDGGMPRIALMAFLRSPSEVIPSWPHIVLLGAAVAVLRLGRRGEIVVMLQAGIAAPRLLAAVFLGGASLGLLHAVALAPLSAAAFGLADRIGADARSTPAALNARPVALAGPEGTLFIFPLQSRPDGGLADTPRNGPETAAADGAGDQAGDAPTLGALALVAIDHGHGVAAWVEAGSARWTGAHWQLDRLVDKVPGDVGLDADGRLHGVGFQALTRAPRDGRALAPAALRDEVTFLESVGAPAARYRMQLAWTLGLPLLLGAVAALGGAIMLVPMARGVPLRASAQVLVAGFAVYTGSTVMEALGGAGAIPVTVAAILTPLACLGATAVVVRLRGL